MPLKKFRRRVDRYRDRVIAPLPSALTLNHYANAPDVKGTGRWKKSMQINHEIIVARKNCEEEVDGDSALTEQLNALTVAGKKTLECMGDQNDDEGVLFPKDLWFLLGDYIDPTQVNTFALICKDAYKVTLTCKFWVSLYKRFVNRGSGDLPVELELSSIRERPGLRAGVVRALYYRYSPLISEAALLPHDVTSLVGTHCIRMWREKISEEERGQNGVQWRYKFRLKRGKLLAPSIPICFNMDAGCVLLTIPSADFYPLPCVEGMRLASVKKSPSVVSLTFSSSPLAITSSTMGLIGLCIPAVAAPTVHPWWVPAYHICPPCITRPPKP